MQDKNKSNEELINELNDLRKQVAVMEKERLHLAIYKKIFLTTNDHFSIISPDYEYIEVNNSYLKAHGINRTDIVEHKISDVFGKDVFDNFIKKNIDICKTGKEINYAKWFEFPIGKRKFMQVNYHPCYVNKEIKGIIVNSYDITKLKEKEILLEKTNLEKDKLFSIIAHDLRSPFSGILGFTELLIKNSEGYSKEKYIEIIKIINSLTENTLGLLENLLEWANFQRHKTPFSVKILNLSSLVNNELSSLKETALLKNIEINSKIDSNLIAWADENMLKVILRNLIVNALKFTQKEGKITLNAVREKYIVKISVQDNGVGIEEDRIENLFTVEQKSSTPGTQGEKGTGLGLMLCKEFVEKHGGEISVESKFGNGSTFNFTIPNKF